MLDFQKLMAQIENVGHDSLVDKLPFEEILSRAQEAYLDAAVVPDSVLERLQNNQDEVLWPLALPIEPFGAKFEINSQNSPLTVVATDGSQIMPSHHEVHSCYVLNIGKVAISYGAKYAPLLESEPRLYHRPEDLYPLVDRRRLHIDELYVSLERNLLELEELCALAKQAKDVKLPVVALLDGTLITWSVERMSEGYRTEYVKRMRNCLQAFQENKIPLIGYLSQSRGADLVNDLRVMACPYDVSSCRKHCAQLNEEDFPCSKIWPLSDRQLLSQQLPYSWRSSIYLSGATISRLLPASQRTCFCYLNVGTEIARLEFPAWLAKQPELLKLGAAAVLAQVQKGGGYPVVLAEAHNLAVIKGDERSRFFELMTRQLMGTGVKRVQVSPKELRKRQGII
jgi:hypothetical protein